MWAFRRIASAVLIQSSDNRSSVAVLVAQNISKVYRLYSKPADRIREALLPFGRPLHDEFWALRDINFKIEKGETFGIIGPNGGGKSTLLQLLCGILQPSTGRVVRVGRIAALLELGAGFNLEFSGRENVYLNAEIMGLKRAEVEQSMPAIERFAGIGKFMDRPVKTYSSGMHVRLAFSAAIHVNPDILVVDEALAVGDAVFANRCVKKLEELKESGVTIVFVSHDLGLVKQICTRAIFLMDGRIQAAGDPSDVVNQYVGKVLERQRADDRERAAEAEGVTPSHRHGDGAGQIVEVEVLGADGEPTRAVASGEAIKIRVRSRFAESQPEPMVGILIRTRNGLDVYGTNTKIEESSFGPCSAGDELVVEFEFDCRLTPQEYTLTVATQHPSGHSHDWLDDAIAFRVTDAKTRAGVANLATKVTGRVVKGAPS